MPGVASAPTTLIHLTRDPRKLVTPQMRLQFSVEAQRLLPYCCQEWSKVFDPLKRAYSLSLAMGLTTILTTIWVCPPNYA